MSEKERVGAAAFGSGAIWRCLRAVSMYMLRQNYVCSVVLQVFCICHVFEGRWNGVNLTSLFLTFRPFGALINSINYLINKKKKID